MSVPLTITLNSIVGTPGPFNLYSDVDNYVTAFETGISLSSLQNSFGTSSAPNGTTNIKIKSTGAGCNYEIVKSISGLPATPTPTMTPTLPLLSLTPTPTVTSTPVFYWYELTRCDDGATCYSTPQVGGLQNRIFHSAGDYYYVMGANYNTTGPDPGNGDGSCNDKVDGSAMPGGVTCESLGITPLPSAAYRTASISFFSPTTYRTYSEVLTDICGKNPSQIVGNGYNTGLGGWINDPSVVTGTTYQLYNSNVMGDNTKVTGPGKYCGILIGGQGSNFLYVAYVNSTGEISDWYACP